ncbi:MAG TPA: hypothetical protein VLC93_09185, partial [Myxococcota bacterium]|nr:hypothetical protein [Myxococcota bacterium]
MAVERSSPKRRPVSASGTPERSPRAESAKGSKAQRGDAKKRAPDLPPRVDSEAVRVDGLAAAKANAYAFDLLAASVARAVVKAQDITLPKPLAAFHQALTDVPVTIVLKRGDDSLRGCLPKDRTERKTVDTFLDLLPMHVRAMGSSRFCDELRAKLTQMLEGPRVLDDLWLGTNEGVYELAVMRVSPGGQAARADEAKHALAEAFRGGPPAEPGRLTQDVLLRPYAEADQAVIYGILRALGPMGLVAKPDISAATGLSSGELEALAAGQSITTEVPRERVVTGMLRALMAQPKAALAQWRRYIPATEA